MTIGNAFVYGSPRSISSTRRFRHPISPMEAQRSTSYASRLMSHALMVAPYANYAADYARLFAPNYAVSAWTDRVFGVIDGGYTAVDGWTAAAYGMPRVARTAAAR